MNAPDILRMFFVCCLVSVVCVFSGCSTVKKIQHMPRLLTLKRYSDSQDRIAEEAREQNRLFDEMAAEIERGEFSCRTARQVRRRFKEPVFAREVTRNGRTLEQWLYRHVKDFSGDRVYMYFDEKGSLVDLNFEEGRKTGDQ